MSALFPVISSDLCLLHLKQARAETNLISAQIRAKLLPAVGTNNGKHGGLPGLESNGGQSTLLIHGSGVARRVSLAKYGEKQTNIKSEPASELT